MRVWYFFFSVGLGLIALLCFFACFALLEGSRSDSTYQRKPALAALWAVVGVACVGFGIYLLSL
jgi:uncharacterized membrane protein YedE/YeeE